MKNTRISIKNTRILFENSRILFENSRTSFENSRISQDIMHEIENNLYLCALNCRTRKKGIVFKQDEEGQSCEIE